MVKSDYMKQMIFLLCVVFICCTENKPLEKNKEKTDTSESEKIQVLNVGSFHFGDTPDAHKTEFDESTEAAHQEIRTISKLLARFKPTIICIENLPEHNTEINAAYQEYLKNPINLNSKYGESSMIGFEIGRLSQVDSIYGIDNHMGYNYSVGDFIENSPDLKNAVDPATYLQLTNEPFKEFPALAKREANSNNLSLLEKFKLINEPVYLDYSITTNADKLLYVGIEDGFEGADNAALFYHRNMKIYTNLNRIPMTKEDRVFIIMGTAHTAFLREFINRSPKFEMVNTLEYLNE